MSALKLNDVIEIEYLKTDGSVETYEGPIVPLNRHQQAYASTHIAVHTRKGFRSFKIENVLSHRVLAYS